MYSSGRVPDHESETKRERQKPSIMDEKETIVDAEKAKPVITSDSNISGAASDPSVARGEACVAKSLSWYQVSRF